MDEMDEESRHMMMGLDTFQLKTVNFVSHLPVPRPSGHADLNDLNE